MIKNKKVLLVSCLFVVLAMGQILSGPETKESEKDHFKLFLYLTGKGKDICPDRIRLPRHL